MINKILILISTLIILAGIVGVKEKMVGKRIFLLCVSSAGAAALSFVQMTTYGIMGGFIQGLFRFVSLLFLVFLLVSICKRNSIKEMSDMSGIGRAMPYAFLAVVIFSMIVTGMPMTGTFSGILYSGMGLLSKDFGAATWIGIIGNMAGIIVPVMLLFPVLKQAYFPGEEMGRNAVKPKTGIVILCLFAAVVLVAFCICPKPVLELAQKLMEGILN